MRTHEIPLLCVQQVCGGIPMMRRSTVGGWAVSSAGARETSQSLESPTLPDRLYQKAKHAQTVSAVLSNEKHPTHRFLSLLLPMAPAVSCLVRFGQTQKVGERVVLVTSTTFSQLFGLSFSIRVSVGVDIDSIYGGLSSTVISRLRTAENEIRPVGSPGPGAFSLAQRDDNRPSEPANRWRTNKHSSFSLPLFSSSFFSPFFFGLFEAVPRR
jgi:hypothetical protein